MITTREWLAAVASTDDRPAVREIAKRTLDEMNDLRAALGVMHRNFDNEVRTHCDPCLNGPAEGRCGREKML